MHTVHGKYGRVHPTFAIITTGANELVAHIHSRMPVILQEKDEDDWLNPQLPLADTQALLAPYPADPLTMYEVSPKVNSPAFNSRFAHFEMRFGELLQIWPKRLNFHIRREPKSFI